MRIDIVVEYNKTKQLKVLIIKCILRLFRINVKVKPLPEEIKLNKSIIKKVHLNHTDWD